MNRQIELTIRGLHTEETGDLAPLETVVRAEYFRKNGSQYLFYRETQEGYEQPSKSRIKFKNGLVELTRQGLVETHMVFEEGRKHMSRYSMPYGELLLGIDTKKVTLKEQEDDIRVEIDYSLEIDGAHQADSRIELHLQNLV